MGQSVIQGGCVAFKNVIDISQFIKILTWIFSNEINEQFKLILPSFSMSVVIFHDKVEFKMPCLYMDSKRPTGLFGGN